MRKGIYYLLISIFLIGIVFFAFEIVNMMVSLKYETNNPDDCISQISGADLCLTIVIFKWLLATSVVGLISLLFFKKRIQKQR